MEQNEKVNAMVSALALQQINVNHVVAEAIILTYEKINEIGGEFSLNHIREIQMGLMEKYNVGNANIQEQA
jgi:hypothetical protein